MASTHAARSTPRGTTLLEAVIALTILLIGLVGMMRLQVWGSNSDEGARSHTQATQLGQELLTGLQRLPLADPRLAQQFTGTTAPPGFGELFKGGSLATTPFAVWSDGSPIPGVTPDSELTPRTGKDSVDGSLPRFQRRWTVWMPTTPMTTDSTKLIAVSVSWRERGFPQMREVVLYGTVVNPAAVTAFIGLQ